MDRFILGAGVGSAVIFLFFLIGRRFSRIQTLKSIVTGFLVLNGLGVLALSAVLLIRSPIPAQEIGTAARTTQQAQEQAGGGYKEMAAALAVGFAAIGAGIAVAVTGSAAIGGMTQNPDIFGRSLVFVGLAEGIAIYGLIISFMILMGFGGGGGG